MIRASRRVFTLSVMLSAAFALTSCNLISGLFGGGDSEETTTPTSTLAEQVASEWATEMSTSSTVRALAVAKSSSALTSSQIASIKSRALASVVAEGYGQSTDTLDDLLPVFIRGVGTAVQVEVGGDEAVIASTLSITARAAVKSAGKSGRESSISGTVQAVITASTSEVATQILSTVTDTELRNEAVADAVQEAVEAFDSVDAISAEADVQSLITETVQAVASTAFGQVDASEAAALSQAIVTQAVVATGSLTKVSTSSCTATANQIVAAVTTAVIEQSADDSSFSSVSSDILVSASAGVVEAAVTVSITVDTTAIANAIQAAVDTATSSGTTTTVTAPTSTTLDAVVNETAPSASATISATTLSAIGTVTLDGAASSAGTGSSGITYTWRQTSGPSVSISDPSATSFTVDIVADGTYIFRLTVKNVDGYRTASTTVSVVASGIDAAASATKIAQGIQALKVMNFDAAQAYFADAADDTNATDEAKFWASLLDLASLSTEDDVVSLMSDRIGLSSYPSTMNELFSDTWFNQEWYTGAEGFVQNDSGYYVRGTFTASTDGSGSYISYYDADYNYSYEQGTFTVSSTGDDYAYYYGLYSASIAYTASDCYYHSYDLINELSDVVMLPALDVPTSWTTDLFSAYGTTAAKPPLEMYIGVLAANIVVRNPDGLNDALDAVLSGVYGTAFEALYSSIQGLGDSTLVTIPADLLETFGAPSGSPDVQIGTLELKAYAAQMKMQKSFLQLLASYNLTYPLDDLAAVDFYDDTDADNNDLPDAMEALLASAPNPIEAGFLSNRSQTIRNAAKTSMTTALTDLSAALTAMIADDGDNDATTGYLDRYVTYSGDSTDLATINGYVGMAQSYASGLASALSGGSAYAITLGDGSSMAVYPAALYSAAVLSPSYLFETNTATTGFVLYGTADSYDADLDEHSADVSTLGAYDLTKHCWFFLKVKQDAFDALYPDSSTGAGDGGYAMLAAFNASAISDSSGNIYQRFAVYESDVYGATFPAVGTDVPSVSLTLSWLAGE